MKNLCLLTGLIACSLATLFFIITAQNVRDASEVINTECLVNEIGQCVEGQDHEWGPVYWVYIFKHLTISDYHGGLSCSYQSSYRAMNRDKCFVRMPSLNESFPCNYVVTKRECCDDCSRQGEISEARKGYYVAALFTFCGLWLCGCGACEHYNDHVTRRSYMRF